MIQSGGIYHLLRVRGVFRVIFICFLIENQHDTRHNESSLTNQENPLSLLMTRHNALDTFNSYLFHKNTVKSEYARDLRNLNFKDKPVKTFVGNEKNYKRNGRERHRWYDQ